MKILINALSVTNASGRHVALGHLARFAPLTVGRHEYTVLFHATNKDICRDFGPNVSFRECPASTAHWAGRVLWERSQLRGVVRGSGIGAVISMSGTVTDGLDVPQATLAMNPWALVPELNLAATDRLKAGLQRYGYRRAVHSARVMAYLSNFMREAYRENAGRDARAAKITYAGVDEATFEAAASRGSDVSRRPLQIVSVSVMARHKGVETLVAALARLREEYGVPATLLLVGGWPDASYRREIEVQIQRLSLENAVRFAGHVSREELHAAYAESQVYCLMSWCESFGIPAAEAQAFGTPVVSSNCCAIPEVCGEGGLYPTPGRDDEVAAALATVLTDRSRWDALSAASRTNVERFRWERCSLPFVELIDELAGS